MKKYYKVHHLAMLDMQKEDILEIKFKKGEYELMLKIINGQI